MDGMGRLERLEQIALNQTLIIEQLTRLVRDMAPKAAVERALDSSAEGLLELVFGQDVPMEMLGLVVDWRRSLAGVQDVMLTS